jgi:type I restriction enzyme S subunit
MEEEVLIEKVVATELPEGWSWKTMEEVSEVVGGATPKTGNADNFEGGDIAWLTPADLSGYTDKFIERGARYITKAGLESCSTKLVPKGTVLFTSRAPIGYVAIASTEVCTNQGFKSYVPDTAQVTSDYLYWWLKGAKAMAEAVASGTTFLELSTVKARKLPIPIAPLPQQRRIVSAIELQLGRLDAAVARLHAAKAKLKRYKQAVLKAAVEGALTNPGLPEGELPEGWRVVRVEDVGQIVTGNTPSKSVSAYYGEDHPFYKPSDLDAGYETSESTDGLTSAGLNEARALPARSILVTCIGATIGKTGLIRVSGACNQQINAIIPNESLVPEYGYFHCISPYFQKQIKDNASATTLPLLNKNRFKALDFILPTKKDQIQLVKHIEERLERADDIESILDAQLVQAGRLRQAVLKRAFEGRLV